MPQTPALRQLYDAHLDIKGQQELESQLTLDALFVGVASFIQSLGLDAYFLLGIAIHSYHAITPRHNVDEFASTRISDVRCILHHAREAKCYISIPEAGQ